MLNTINTVDIARLRQMADIIYQASETMTYLGFCQKGTEEITDKGWSILRIVENAPHGTYPRVTQFKWANGSCSFNLIFDNFATYDYYYHKF